jgi:hypothetical protein
MRRTVQQDPNGLSVNYDCTIDQMRSRQPYPIAIGELKVEDIRKIQTPSALDVVPTSREHANITGLPVRGEDIEKAERLAEQLAKICTCIYPEAPAPKTQWQQATPL